VGWLIDPKMALWSLVLVDVWQWTPFAFIVMQAGLSSIPQEVFEASVVDGATYRQRLFPDHAAHPAGPDTLALSSEDYRYVQDILESLRVDGGGPGNATETTSFFVYREAFQYFNLGRSSAASMITLVASSSCRFSISGKCSIQERRSHGILCDHKTFAIIPNSHDLLFS
jgi:multiple sugar transport system permease protein